MKQLLTLMTMWLILACSAPLFASSDTDELTRMLNEFLAGASQNDAAAHDRFWAADLIYTSSAGERISKADIMREVMAPADPAKDEASSIYSAEDIRIQQYGNTAIVAFRLIGASRGEQVELTQYFNTGTFLKRDGIWRVVAWQATRIPEQR